MLYMCDSCHQIFNNPFGLVFNTQNILQGIDRCPMPGCYGQLFEVDELMAPIIKKFLDLGFETKYCCSGHVHEPFSSPYISFNSSIFGREYALAMYDILVKYLRKPWIIELNAVYREEELKRLGIKSPKLPYNYSVLGEDSPEKEKLYWEEINRLNREIIDKSFDIEEEENNNIIIRALLQNWDDTNDKWFKIENYKSEILDDEDWLSPCDLCDRVGLTSNNERISHCPDREKIKALSQKYEAKYAMEQDKIYYPDSYKANIEDKEYNGYYGKEIEDTYGQYRKIVRANNVLYECLRAIEMDGISLIED